MRVKLGAFPAFYFNVTCKLHNCKVMCRIDSQHTGGASVTTMQCEVGGSPAMHSCENEWEVAISGTGDITVVSN